MAIPAYEQSLRPVTLALKPGDRVVVTAANGFIGSAVVRAFIERGLRVVAVMDSSIGYPSTVGEESERVQVDILDEEAMTRAFDGARVVVHIAPDYRLVSKDPKSFQSINVDGTRLVLRAARAAGCEKVVYTSSVGTLELEGTSIDAPADERNIAHFDQLDGFYRKSKYSAEHEVLRIAAAGLPVTLVLPTTSLGPFDYAPTPSGRIVVSFLNGSTSGWFDTALNLVDVDDLANGYVLAAERGVIGHRYILGGKNLDFSAVYALLAETTGLRPSGFRVPRSLAMAAAFSSQLIEGRILRREPSIPMEGVRLSTRPLVFSDQRARNELGYTTRETIETIERAARWFVDNGYVRRASLAKIAWRGSS